MNYYQTLILGLISGFTIFLGLPIVKIKNFSRSWQAFLNALSAGILVFLLWDVITEINRTIEFGLKSAQSGQPMTLASLLIVFILGFGTGLLGLVYFEKKYIARKNVEVLGKQQLNPLHLSAMIAVGIGMHNFSEGLAIGQAAISNLISLATILVIGFCLHNATEGFGIVAPLASLAKKPSWRQLGILGIIGGGPTFIGTVIGYNFHSDILFVLFLALAAGSIFYVISELLHVGRSFKVKEITSFGIVVGFFIAYLADIFLTFIER